MDHFVRVATVLKTEPSLALRFLQAFLGKDKTVENATVACIVREEKYACAQFEATIDGEEGIVNVFVEG